MKIKKILEINTIKAGINSTILNDGTIKDPENYNCVTIIFDDSIIIQVERPLTITKIKNAYNTKIADIKSIDGISENQDIIMT